MREFFCVEKVSKKDKNLAEQVSVTVSVSKIFFETGFSGFCLGLGFHPWFLANCKNKKLKSGNITFDVLGFFGKQVAFLWT